MIVLYNWRPEPSYRYFRFSGRPAPHQAIDGGRDLVAHGPVPLRSAGVGRHFRGALSARSLLATHEPYLRFPASGLSRFLVFASPSKRDDACRRLWALCTFFGALKRARLNTLQVSDPVIAQVVL